MDKQTILNNIKKTHIVLAVIATILGVLTSIVAETAMSLILVAIIYVYLLSNIMMLNKCDKANELSTVYAYCESVEKNKGFIASAKGVATKGEIYTYKLNIVSMDGKFIEGDRCIYIAGKARAYREGNLYCILFKVKKDGYLDSKLTLGKIEVPVSSDDFFEGEDVPSDMNDAPPSNDEWADAL